MSGAFTVGWSVLFAAGLALEAAALVRRGKGDTLSEHVWLIRSTRWGRPAFYAAWSWLTYHFIIDEFLGPQVKSAAWDDWAAVAAGAVIGLALAVRGVRARA